MAENNDAYNTFVHNATGIEVDDKNKIYERMSPVKRKIFLASKPKTVESFVQYSECADSVYEVYMLYVE